VTNCKRPHQSPELARPDIEEVSALPTPPVIGNFRMAPGVSPLSMAPEVSSLSFNDDGRLLAAGYLDGTTHVWNVADGRDAVTLHGHTEEVRSVAFSPDGALLATGSMDQSVVIWDTSRWESDPVRILGLEEWARAIAFSPDGETLAVPSSDDDIRLVLARTEAVADLACRRVTRNLSRGEWIEFVGEDDLTPFDWLFQEDPSEYRSTCEQFPPGEDDPIDEPTTANTGIAVAWWTAPLQRAARGTSAQNRHRRYRGEVRTRELPRAGARLRSEPS